MKLCDNYALSTSKISALKDELATYQNESKLQVTRLQGELKLQNNASTNRIAAATTTTRKVCVDI